MHTELVAKCKMAQAKLFGPSSVMAMSDSLPTSFPTRAWTGVKRGYQSRFGRVSVVAKQKGKKNTSDSRETILFSALPTILGQFI
jgi:hypothetical protein